MQSVIITNSTSSYI